MANRSHQEDEQHGSRMRLEPDAIHQGDGGVYIDCPQCGSNVSIARLITDGTCSGTVDGRMAETIDDTDVATRCTANLSLELVWEE